MSTTAKDAGPDRPAGPSIFTLIIALLLLAATLAAAYIAFLWQPDGIT